MIKFRSLSALCSTAAVLLLVSCNNSSQTTDNEAKEADTTTASTSTTTPTETSTIVTTPQNMMVAIHKVANFSKWLTSYEANDSLRLANGIHSYVVARGAEDSNTVMVVVKTDDVAKAKEFSKGGLKTAMQKSGVIGKPKVMFNTLVFQDTGAVSTDLRSMTTFTVKDWDAWKTSFESRKQLRADNGLSDRAYGYDVDDNHKVSVVVVVNDTAKARAYWNSDLIKQNRAASGVTSPVDRFLYRVVKKY